MCVCSNVGSPIYIYIYRREGTEKIGSACYDLCMAVLEYIWNY